MTKSNRNSLWFSKTTGFPTLQPGNHKLALILSLTVLFNFSLILYRNIHLTDYWSSAQHFTDLLAHDRGTGFVFLIWNLFLAWIPYGLSLLIRQDQSTGPKYLLLLMWLFFFPNAPYIITDLLHLHHRPPVPLWYDMLTIFAFAWTGLIFGYLSLIRVQKVLNAAWGKSMGNILVSSILILAGFGIYIGRFLRWNSWDIVARPRSLFVDLFSIFTNPAVHWPTIGAGILLSIMLLLGYSTLRAISST